MSSESNGTADKVRFKATDPRGIEIIMKEQTWTEHIAPKHNEADEDRIKKNIQSPDLIIRNVKRNPNKQDEYIVDETRQDYIGLFKYSTADGKQSLKVMKTIVQVDEDQTGFVVTNYILRNLNEIKLEGGIIYDRQESVNL